MIEILEASQTATHDPKVLHLINDMIEGRLEEIRPVIDFSKQTGAVYPQVESLLGKTSDEVIKILDSLVEERILKGALLRSPDLLPRV